VPTSSIPSFAIEPAAVGLPGEERLHGASTEKLKKETKMEVRHLDQRQLAERWLVSEATLERWRSEGIGPQFLKIHGRVLSPADRHRVLRGPMPAGIDGQGISGADAGDPVEASPHRLTSCP
jgi:hypothetical protein